MAKITLFGVACIGEIMGDEARRYNFHFWKQQRQFAAGCPSGHEELGVRDVSAGSFGKIKVRRKQLAFSWRLPTDAEFCISWRD